MDFGTIQILNGTEKPCTSSSPQNALILRFNVGKRDLISQISLCELSTAGCRLLIIRIHAAMPSKWAQLTRNFFVPFLDRHRASIYPYERRSQFWGSI